MKILGIIPARSGSKGLKNKNIKLLKKKPLISYTIEAAKKSKIFDKIILSTDSEKYAKIGKQYGADIPFLREKKLSNDKASSIDVIIDVIKKLEEKGEYYETIILLQPTSPLRNYKDIIKAWNLFKEKEANSVVSVSESKINPLWCNTLDEKLSMDNFLNEEVKKRRQELSKFYELNGAIYIADIDYLKENKDFYVKNSYAYIMSKKNSIDIDDEFDFKLAEILMENQDENIDG